MIADGKLLPRAREAGAPAPVPDAIFAALEVRDIFTAALSSWVDEGTLDVVHAVRELAAVRPLQTIPRLPRRTLRRGAQLLLDRSASIAPFAADVRSLEGELRCLLGSGQLERLFFSRCPLRGVRDGMRGHRRSWRPPPRGVPLLIASDFGLSGDPLDDDRASAAEWRRFALEARGDDRVCVGLVPFARERWPATLTDLITFVHWSEHTVALAVDRALRDAKRRHR
jgi:hypothetical protein